jgi:hypothetical protein
MSKVKNKWLTDTINSDMMKEVDRLERHLELTKETNRLLWEYLYDLGIKQQVLTRVRERKRDAK